MDNKYNLKSQTHQSEKDYPWLDDKKWINGKIHSNARGLFYLILFFAVGWNLLSFPISFFAISDTYNGWEIDHIDPVLGVLLFPIVGIGLIFLSYKSYRQWSAFGRLSMTLDPYPGSIGGDVGGFLQLPIAWQPGYDFKISINCIHHTISRSGKNSSHKQHVIWKKHAAVEYKPSAAGISLKFKCPIDEGLQESTPKSGHSYYRWAAHIKGQNKQSAIKLDREFDIPVFKLKTAQTSRLYIISPTPEMDIEQISEEQVQIKQKTRSLELMYSPSRYASMAKVLLLFSLFFLCATGFLVYGTWSEIEQSNSFTFFIAGVSGFISLIFAIVGLTMLGLAIHLLSSHLQVLINSSGIKVNSRSFLRNSTKLATFSEIDTISKKTKVSSGRGSSATLYYTITALLKNGQKVILGNGIKGQLAADSLIKLIKKQISMYL